MQKPGGGGRGGSLGLALGAAHNYDSAKYERDGNDDCQWRPCVGLSQHDVSVYVFMTIAVPLTVASLLLLRPSALLSAI